MRRLGEFGRWFRQFRIDRGFQSGAELSRRAGLNRAYLSDLERGKALPKRQTINQLAKAMKLRPAERQELERRAGLAKVPTDLRRELAGPPAPDLAVWRHLPRFLYQVEHSFRWWNDDAPEDIAADAIRAGASLLAWIALSESHPSERMRARLIKTIASMVRQRGGSDQLDTRDPTELLQIASEGMLAQVWREQVFGTERSARRVVSRLRRWEYVENRDLAWPGTLVFRFREQGLDREYSVNRVTATTIASVHDAMIAHTLWVQLGAAQRSRLPSNVFYRWVPLPLLTAIRRLDSLEPTRVRRDLTRGGGLDDCLKNECLDATRSMRMAVRAFSVPGLARLMVDHLRTPGMWAAATESVEDCLAALVVKADAIDQVILDVHANASWSLGRPALDEL